MKQKFKSMIQERVVSWFCHAAGYFWMKASYHVLLALGPCCCTPNQMHDIIVTREVLALYDKYDGDFGLMYERWADEKDRYKLTSEQSSLLSEYVDKLHLIKIRTFAMQLLRERALKRLPEIEEVMDPKVAAILRKRVLET